MASLEQQCRSTARIIIESILDDENWQAFGYHRRPRRRKIFRFFISENKIEKETVLLRELWVASFARVVYWASKKDKFVNKIDFIARLVEICLEGIGEPLWPVFRFPNFIDALDFLKKGCKEYNRKSLRSHPNVFLERSKFRLNQPLPTAWLYGASWLFSNSMISNIIPALNITRVAENEKSDIVVNSFYREIAANILIKPRRKK